MQLATAAGRRAGSGVSWPVWIGVALLGGCGALGPALRADPACRRPPPPAPPGVGGTLAVNLSGAFLLGLLAGAAVEGDARLLLGAGLIGSYTTFSTWMLETQRIEEAGKRRIAVANVLLSIALGTPPPPALGRALGSHLFLSGDDNEKEQVNDSGSALGGFVADHLAVVGFAHPALVDQQVGVADHLGEGEEGLGDGDVAPDRLGDLVAAARLLGDQPVDLLLAPLVLARRASISATWSVIGSPWPGRTISAGISRVFRIDSM